MVYDLEDIDTQENSTIQKDKYKTVSEQDAS